jgi:hypothetical protein
MKSSTYDDSSGMPATPEKALCGSVSAITEGEMSKRTPGSWEWVGDYNYTNDGSRIILADGVGIAHVLPVADRKRSTPYNATDEGRDANAQLMAAAPRLLEALTGLLRQCTFPTSGNDAFQAAVSKARDAVAPLVTPNTN